MHNDIKKQWVKALRSGEYVQGNGCLKDSQNKYCCLGVLTDIYNKAHNKKNRGYKNRNQVLADNVKKWAGLAHDNPSYNCEFGSSLAEINDNGRSFNFIADIIEDNF